MLLTRPRATIIGGTVAMDCLDESTIFGLADGGLAADAQGRALRHIGTCDACRELVAETAKSLGVDRIATGADEEAAPVDESGPAPLEAGTAVGRYRIEACLGAGAMGIVYAAEDTVLGRRVALKFLRAVDRGADGEGRRARLAREARVMARLSHPNVVGIYDLGQHEGRLFVAMELVEGSTLEAWRAASPRKSRAILEAFIAAGRGLAAAHAAGVVHRDFKPANVLVADDGRVRVTDFGLARSHEEGPSLPRSGPDGAETLTVTRADAILGTPAYMSPEQLRGGRATERSDQFSFAVSLYEALHGRRPFDGETLGALAAAIDAGPARAPGSEARIPGGVRRALVRALSARPEDRFASMSDLVSVLERRPRARLVVAALLALAGAVGLAAALLRARTAGPTHIRECRGVDGVCEGGEFCHYMHGNVCGAAEEPGVCWPRPSTCPPLERLACGCNGKTYVSGCAANREGVSSAYAGPCVPCDRGVPDAGRVRAARRSSGRRVSVSPALPKNIPINRGLRG